MTDPPRGAWHVTDDDLRLYAAGTCAPDRSTTFGTCAFAMKQSSPVTRSQLVISGIEVSIAATRFNSPGIGRMRRITPSGKPIAPGRTRTV